jgi:hypothetical protein
MVFRAGAALVQIRPNLADGAFGCATNHLDWSGLGGIKSYISQNLTQSLWEGGEED